MTAAHCPDCDTYDCPGFTTPRATPEPVPALRPERPADAATRRAALDKIRADLDAARRKVEGR